MFFDSRFLSNWLAIAAFTFRALDVPYRVIALRGARVFNNCFSSSLGITSACCFACCAASLVSFALLFSGFFCLPSSSAFAADCDLSALLIGFFFVPPIFFSLPPREFEFPRSQSISCIKISINHLLLRGNRECVSSFSARKFFSLSRKKRNGLL